MLIYKIDNKLENLLSHRTNKTSVLLKLKTGFDRTNVLIYNVVGSGEAKPPRGGRNCGMDGDGEKEDKS